MDVYLPVTLPDLFVQGRYSLSSVVNWLPAVPHWASGVQYDCDCPEVSVTISPCVSGAPAQVPTKAVTWTHKTRGSRSFDIFERVDCSPADGASWDTLQAKALRALSMAGPTQLERTFWSGVSGAAPALVYPNLTSTGVVFDETGRIVLQPSSTLISGTPLDITEALGRLEKALGDCWDGEGVIHAPIQLVESLAAKGLCYRDGSMLRTYVGNVVVGGRGYDPTIGPGGTTPPSGSAWMFATGPVFGFRGVPRVANNTESFDRNVNTLQMIAEQKHLLGWSCCLVGVLVSTGGEPTGTPNA